MLNEKPTQMSSSVSSLPPSCWDNARIIKQAACNLSILLSFRVLSVNICSMTCRSFRHNMPVLQTHTTSQYFISKPLWRLLLLFSLHKLALVSRNCTDQLFLRPKAKANAQGIGDYLWSFCDYINRQWIIISIKFKWTPLPVCPPCISAWGRSCFVQAYFSIWRCKSH